MEPDAGGGVGAGRPGVRREDRQRTQAVAWVPATDIFARGEDLVVRVSLSGVDREDVRITLSNSVLTVAGERRSELNEGDVSFYVRERYYGAFRRSITLPAGIDEDAISVDFENGLLEITVRGAPPPRRSRAGSRSGTDPAKAPGTSGPSARAVGFRRSTRTENEKPPANGTIWEIDPSQNRFRGGGRS